MLEICKNCAVKNQPWCDETDCYDCEICEILNNNPPTWASQIFLSESVPKMIYKKISEGHITAIDQRPTNVSLYRVFSTLGEVKEED